MMYVCNHSHKTITPRYDTKADFYCKECGKIIAKADAHKFMSVNGSYYLRRNARLSTNQVQ